MPSPTGNGTQRTNRRSTWGLQTDTSRGVMHRRDTLPFSMRHSESTIGTAFDVCSFPRQTQSTVLCSYSCRTETHIEAAASLCSAVRWPVLVFAPTEPSVRLIFFARTEQRCAHPTARFVGCLWRPLKDTNMPSQSDSREGLD